MDRSSRDHYHRTVPHLKSRDPRLRASHHRRQRPDSDFNDLKPAIKPELNGRLTDTNIDEKISKLITKLPQLGKGIRLKKKGEYVSLPVAETEKEAKREDVEGCDLNEIHNNASYWTSDVDEDENEETKEKDVERSSPFKEYVPMGGIAPVMEDDEDLDMPVLDEPYVPEDPGEDFEPYDPEMPTITRAGSVDKDSPTLFEKFASMQGTSSIEQEKPRAPVLEHATVFTESRRLGESGDDKCSKDSDSVHSRELDGLMIDESESETRKSYGFERKVELLNLVEEERAKTLPSSNENGPALAEKVEENVPGVEPISAGIEANKKATTDVAKEQIAQTVSSTAADAYLTDSTQDSKSESPDKRKHGEKERKHHHKKHKKHDRSSSVDKLDRNERQKKYHDHRHTHEKKLEENEAKARKYQESSDEQYRKERSRSKDERQRERESSHSNRDAKHSSMNSSTRRDEKSRHDSDKRKQNTDREGKRTKELKPNTSHERMKKTSRDNADRRKKGEDSGRDSGRRHSHGRRSHREKKGESTPGKDLKQKLIVDTFDFFSLPVKKPKTEAKIPVDARRTVRVPSGKDGGPTSMDGAYPSTSKDGALPSTSKDDFSEPGSSSVDNHKTRNNHKMESKDESAPKVYADESMKERNVESKKVEMLNPDDKNNKSRIPTPIKCPTNLTEKGSESDSTASSSIQMSESSVRRYPKGKKTNLSSSQCEERILPKKKWKTQAQVQTNSESESGVNKGDDIDKESDSVDRIVSIAEPVSMANERTDRSADSSSVRTDGTVLTKPTAKVKLAMLKSDNEDWSSSQEESKRARNVRSLVSWGNDVSPPLVGHKRSSRFGGLRRNQIGRYTPKMVQKRRTNLEREVDEDAPMRKRKNNIFTAFAMAIPQVKEEVQGESESPVASSSSSSSRPSRNRSMPIRYSPPRELPRLKPTTPSATGSTSVGLEMPVSSPPADETQVSEIAHKAQKRTKRKIADAKPFGEISVPTDSISEPYLAFLGQHNRKDAFKRSGNAPLTMRMLNSDADSDSETRFRFPSTMFAESRHGYAVVNKKKIPASMRSHAYHTPPLANSPYGAARKFKRSSAFSPASSPLKGVKSPVKTAAKVLKSPRKSPAKLSPKAGLSKSPIRVKRSPLKVKITRKVVSKADTAKDESEADHTEQVEDTLTKSEAVTAESSTPPSMKADNVFKLSPLAMAKKAFLQATAEQDTSPDLEISFKETSIVEAVPDIVEAVPEAQLAVASETTPKMKKKNLSARSAKQTKLAPFLKLNRHSKLLPIADKKQMILSQFMTSTAMSPPEKVKAEITESEITDETADTPSTTSAADGTSSISAASTHTENVAAVLESVEPPPNESVSEPKDNSSVVLSDLKKSDSSHSIDSPQRNVDSPLGDVIHLDQSSLEDVIRTLELDLEPGKLPELDPTTLPDNLPPVSDETSCSSSVPSDMSDTKPKRRPKLPQKLMGDVILSPLLKITRNEKKTSAGVSNVAVKTGTMKKVDKSEPSKMDVSKLIKIINVEPCQAQQAGPSPPVVTSDTPKHKTVLLKRAVFTPNQQQTIRDLFRLVQMPKKKISSGRPECGIPPRETVPKEKKRRGRPPIVVVSTPVVPAGPNQPPSPKPVSSPKSPKLFGSKPVIFGPKIPKSVADQNRIRLQQKSKKLLKESLRNARQKVVKPSPKIVATPLLLGDRKRLSRGAKERVITYNENSKTRTVDDLEPESSSESDSDDDIASESVISAVDDVPVSDPHQILETLHEHICLVEGLVISDFDIDNKKFLTNPVALLFNADIRKTASLCNCLRFYGLDYDWNDLRKSEVPLQCGVELTTKICGEISDAPELCFDISLGSKSCKKDRNIFDIITSPNDSSSTTFANDFMPLTVKIEDQETANNSMTSVLKNNYKSCVVERTCLTNDETFGSDLAFGQFHDYVKSVSFSDDSGIAHSESSKRGLSQSVECSKRPKMEPVRDEVNAGNAPLFERLDVVESDTSSVLSDGPCMDPEAVRTMELAEIADNPGKMVLQDIYRLLNVCEALEVFLSSDDHLLLDVGGYITVDQALMLGYLCEYDVVMTDGALKLQRTGNSRVPDAADLDAIINNDVYQFGADSTRIVHAPSSFLPEPEPRTIVIHCLPKSVMRPMDSDFVFY